jgi:vesicular inhibitory amino acid transporter
MPYTLYAGGLILGILTILFCSWLSYYCSIILIRSMEARPAQVRNYSDLGEVTFGRTGRIVISVVFFVELFACAAAYVVLIGDTLMQIFPGGFRIPTANSEQPFVIGLVGMKTLAFLLVLLPTSLISQLRWLSVGSVIGLFGSLMLGIVLVADGVTKKDAPGSLVIPAAVRIVPNTLRNCLLIPFHAGIYFKNALGINLISVNLFFKVWSCITIAEVPSCRHCIAICGNQTDFRACFV